MLKIDNLKVDIEGKKILKGVDLEVGGGEIHVIMGPNGSGKSTLAQVIAGNPGYKLVAGSKLLVAGRNITKLTADKRAKLGIFLGFQHPVEIPGVSVFNVLRKAGGPIARGPVASFPPTSARLRMKSKGNGQSTGKLRAVGSPSTGATPRTLSKFREHLLEYASSLKLSDDFLRRSLNEGFSGGEKKRSEILQMLVLKPKLVILDEIDSGLDVDGLKIVSSAINQFKKNNPWSSVIIITHYARILKYLKPDFVHVMVEGRIVKSGSSRLATEVEKSGYSTLIQISKIKNQNYNSNFKH